jgi:hypothetical protein
MDSLDLGQGCKPSVAVLHRLLDPLFRVENHCKATHPLAAASLFLLNPQKSALF